MGYTQISASNITDLNGNKLASGTILFLATDQNGEPISFQVAGGGQALRRAISATVTNGAIAAGFQVPDPATTSPRGILYRIWVRDAASGNLVLDYRKVTFQGSSFNLDNYVPSAAVVAPPATGTVTGPLNVSGDFAATGAVSGSGGTLDSQRRNQVRYADKFVGTDAGAMIAAALADLPAEGGTIDARGLQGPQTAATDLVLSKPCRLLLGATTLTISGNLHITSGQVTIEGMGAANSIIQLVDDGSGTSRTLFIDTVSDVLIRDLTVQQSGVTGRTGVYGNVRILNSSRVSVLDCKIGVGSSAAIHTINSTDLQFRGLYISGTYADGIHISRASARVVIVNCLIENTGDDGIGLVGYIDAPTNYGWVTDVTIQGCVLLNNGTGVAGRGIAIDGAAVVAVANCVIENPVNAGIIISGEPDSSGSSVATHFPYHITISSCIIRTPGASASAGTRSGIYVTSARGVTLRGNVIYQPGTDGITVVEAGLDIAVEDNIIERPGGRGVFINPATQTSSSNARLITELWTNFGDGTPASVALTDIGINGNIVRDASLDGIYAVWDNASRILRLRVANNSIFNVLTSSYYGIVVSGADRAVVKSNQIDTCPQGIRLASTDSAVVDGNVVSGLSNTGISLISATNCIVSANQAATGIYVDSGGSGNYVNGNRVGGANPILIQDSTSRAFDNIGSSAPIVTPNGIQVGTAGSALAAVIKTSQSLTFPSIPAGSAQEQTITVTNAATNGTVMVSPQADPGAALQWSARISAANTVAVRVSNPTAAAITPTTVTWDVTVIQ